jgi:hypothetical protein
MGNLLMAKDFAVGLMEVGERVGYGVLTGTVIVDQVYAHYQHERLDLHHPRGGGAKYLERPLFERYGHYMEMLAESVLTTGPDAGMTACVEDLSAQIEHTAPVLWWDLRRSGHPIVMDNGLPVYDRPPMVHRLTEAELKAKGRLIPMPPELVGWIWWHVMKMEHPPNWYRERGIPH